MTWIVGTLILAILAVILWLMAEPIAKALQQAERPYDPSFQAPPARTVKAVARGVAVFLGVVILVWTVFSAFNQVPAGHVGVVYEFGAIVGQTDDGLQVIPPWRSLQNASVQVQSYAFTDEPGNVPPNVTVLGSGLDSFSQETQDVFINARLDIQVSPRDVQSLYREVGPDYVNKLVPQRVTQIFKDETVRFSTVDIAPNREAIRESVELRIDDELEAFSIDVVALLIDDIDFQPEFKNAIEAKQVATQEALREEELVRKAEFEAQQQIELAQGEAGALVVIAEGQAEANRLLNESLTPNVIQFKAIELAFAPGSPIQFAFLPSGEGLIIDPSTLLEAAGGGSPPAAGGGPPEVEEEVPATP
jgi:regulator of protease activity HflC (stomatin/prohibitin superfamily)